MKRRGHIEQLPSGRHRARRGKATLGTFDSELLAEAALGGATLGARWEAFALSRRNLVRDWKGEESRWALYFEKDDVTSVPLPELGRKHTKAWLGRMLARGLAPQTIKNAKNLGAALCAELVDNEELAANPFVGLKVPKVAGARRVKATWTVLDPEEQLALLDAASDDEYHFVAFALHTGLRLSEIINLKKADIDLDAGIVTVRRSKGGMLPKSGAARHVPLIGLAWQAARNALETPGSVYAFPSPTTGKKRYDGRPPYGWKAFLKAAKLKRRVRFHDLRHTCATSLLAGWWGRVWTLKEVQQIMGHAQQSTTERYAHLLDETLFKAGRETAGLDPTAWGEAHETPRKASAVVGFGMRTPIKGFATLALKRRHERPEAFWGGAKAKVIPLRWRRVFTKATPHWSGRKWRAA